LRDHPTGNLLGCVGCILSAGSLEETVASVAIGSAEDSRFPPLRMEDLASTTLEISILSPLEQVRVTAQERFPSAIQPGLDGLILQCDGAAGLLLPQVWARVPAPEEFLAVLCFKAGLSDPDAWRGAGVKLYRFQVHVFREMTPGGEVEEKHGPWYTEEGDVTEP
jgi:AmmeMemoRadiSam system protein A